MKNFSKKLFFGDALDDVDIGGIGNLMPNLQDLLGDNDNNSQNNNNNNDNTNSNNANNNDLPSEDNDLDFGGNYDENDLGIEVICSDDEGKIFKLTDLIIPLYDSKKESTENYLRKMIERVKKDKNEKNDKDDIKKREKNEKEEISKLMKKSKKSQKYSKINVGYDEKFFDKTLFLKKNNSEFKDSENKNNNIEEEKSRQEIKKDNLNKTKINYDYDDLIKNTLFQFKKHYNNSNINQNGNVNENEKEDIEEVDKKKMQIEEDLTKDFKCKIYQKLNDLNEKEKDNANKENIPNQDGLFLGEPSFLNFSKNNSLFMNELLNKNKTNIFIKNENDNNNIFQFNESQLHYDKYDLQDFIKKKRNRADGYINNNIASGAFMNSYITNSKITKNYKENSRIIYDLNDYNMNFEIIEEQNNNDENKNDNLNNFLISIYNNPNNVINDFFSTLPKRVNDYSHKLNGIQKEVILLMQNALMVWIIMI